jgi:hypothetical protein
VIGLIGPLLQPFASGNQALGVVVLFGRAGAAVHDAQGQRRHGSVKSGELGE